MKEIKGSVQVFEADNCPDPMCDHDDNCLECPYFEYMDDDIVGCSYDESEEYKEEHKEEHKEEDVTDRKLAMEAPGQNMLFNDAANRTEEKHD